MDKDQNILIVYYSQTGNVKFIAEKISDLSNSELKQISEICSNVRFTKIELLKYYLFNIKPKNRIKEDELLMYDKIFFGYPIWIFGKTHPLFALLKEKIQELGKEYGVFTSFSFYAWNFPGKLASSNLYLDSLKMRDPLNSDEIESNNIIQNWIQALI